MSGNLTLALVAGGLWGAGVFLLLQRTLTRIVIGIVLVGHGTNLVLLAAGGPAGVPPFTGAEGTVSDPLPQGMVLTAIVITFGVTTLLLALAYRSFVLTGRDEVQDDPADAAIVQRTVLHEVDEPDGEDTPAADSDEELVR